jgi:hypothetical protein
VLSDGAGAQCAEVAVLEDDDGQARADLDDVREPEDGAEVAHEPIGDDAAAGDDLVRRGITQHERVVRVVERQAHVEGLRWEDVRRLLREAGARRGGRPERLGVEALRARIEGDQAGQPRDNGTQGSHVHLRVELAV